MSPLFAPRSVVAVCLLLPLAPAGAAAAPADPAPVTAPEPESGWRSRFAATPRKLAFWKKNGEPAAAAEQTPAKPVPPPPPPPSKKAAAPPAAAPAIPEPTPEKSGFFSRLPSLSLPNPFATKSGTEPDAEAARPHPAAPAAAKPAKPAAAKIKPVRTERLGPAAPDTPNESTTKPSTAEAAPRKPSFWSRLATAVVPGESDDPASTVAKPPAAGPAPATEVGPTTFVITKDESPFYGFGPHQATPPDAYLSTGTVVTLEEKTWGWAQVRLSDGRSGTIARNAIRPATAADLVPAFAPPSLVAATPRRRGGESFVVPPAALPDLPTGPVSAEAAAEAEELSSALLPPFAE